MLLISAAASWLIYRSEESLMISEHTRLLRTVERLTGDYYRRTHLFFNIVRNKITQGELDVTRDGFDFAPDFHSVLILDRQGNILETYCRQECSPGQFHLGKYQRKLIQPIVEGKVDRKGAVYYEAKEKTVLLSYAFAFEDKIYLISSDAQAFLNKLAYYIQKKEERSVAIINQDGIYIYDSRDPSLVESEENFFEEGAYYAAVKDHDPYEVTEYPEHYQKGDTFWDGIFDVDNFLSYAHIADFDWIAIVHDHADAVDRYLQKALLAVIIVLVLTVLLTILSANMMSKYIIIPVERLIKNINAFARNERDEEQDQTVTTYPIFENLVSSFNTMRTQIIAREQKLKEKVEENLRMQDQLIQQEKHAAMGEMIGNIAHQWRQPLSVISTLATGLQTEQELGVASPDRVHDVCTQINDNAQYLSGTIDDFRQFIKGEHTKADFQASDLIESLVNLMKGHFRQHEIDVEISVEENLMIHGYRNDLLQVLINLISNAKDALLENKQKDRVIRIVAQAEASGDVEIHVVDNGGGIDNEIINRIFEPYFTTKHKSQGTGLGLHMVHRLVVEGMEGDIMVRTIEFIYKEERHTGAEFVIILPGKERQSDKGE